MERSTPVRKPHTSTADLLTWTEAPLSDPPVNVRQNQPSDGVRKVVFGGEITKEEAESVLKRKPCSGPKLKEMNGSGIFNKTDKEAAESEHGSSFSTPTQQTSSRAFQQSKAASQISFSTDGTVSLKKPTSLAEVAKQRELSGTLQSGSETKANKQLSNAKSKELSGHGIFAPPPEIKPRPSAARTSEIDPKDFGESNSSNIQSPLKLSKPVGSSAFLFGEESGTKTTKKINAQKVAELTGNNIFKGDVPPGVAEKSLSGAKLKEMSGSDIFGDGKAPSRDYYSGIRKPPGGESSIALV